VEKGIIAVPLTHSSLSYQSTITFCKKVIDHKDARSTEKYIT
jgi:hypothetical protein